MITKLRYTKMMYRTETLSTGKVLVLKKDATIELDSKEMKDKVVKELMKTNNLVVTGKVKEENNSGSSDTETEKTDTAKSDKNKKKEGK